MSWAVKRILSFAADRADVQLGSDLALQKVLDSIMTVPEDWTSTLSQIASHSTKISDSEPVLVYSVGESMISTTLAKKLGLRVEALDHLPPSTATAEPLLSTPSHQYPDSAVAVIGMACKFPGADSLEDLWKILEAGTNMVDELPLDRFPDSRFEKKGLKKNFKANLISDIDAFDNKFFKFSSREALYMDPQQRLALEVTYQALESAGYFATQDTELERDMGCYMATCNAEYTENVCTYDPSAFSLTGSVRSFIAGRISHHFNWTGPALMTDAACAASGTAINMACRAVASGECATAIAGGTNIFVSPDTFSNLAGGHFISPTGQSKSFDASADGYCRGEGIAIIVLKKLNDALRDGDLIKGVISASAVNNNVNETAIIVPHARSQMNLYRKALKQAGLSPRDVSYVEAHGTGTQVGDPIEAESIRGVFGGEHRHHSGKTYLGSVKSNIGHTEATSGLSGLFKVMLMMEKGMITKQAIFKNLNPSIPPLEPSGIEINTAHIPWNTPFKAACVNNYGASGTNATMIVTEPPVKSQSSRLADTASLATSYPVSITAFTASSLASYAGALLKLLDQATTSQVTLARDIAYHLSRRRNPNLPFIASTTISSLQDLRVFLTSTASPSSEPQKKEKHKLKQPIVLCFGGQTGKAAVIPRSFYDTSSIFRKHIDACETILQGLGAPSIIPAIFEPDTHNEDLLLSHAILFCGQYASAMAWIDCGLKPARLIGHSFGQLTALCVSGALSLRDGLWLITERARLIKEQWGEDSGSMMTIEADIDQVEALLASRTDLKLDISCHNGPQSYVVGGSTASMDEFETWLKSSGQTLRWKRLQVTNAFHSHLTESLLEPLLKITRQLHLRKPKFTLETCSKDQSWASPTPELIANHLRQPVYFTQAISRIASQLGPCIWLEAGTGSVAPMLKRALGAQQASSHAIKAMTLTSTSSVKTLADCTAELWGLGVGVQFWAFHGSQQGDYAVMNLPPYQFDKQRFWLDFKEPKVVAAEVQSSVAMPMMALLQPVKVTNESGEFTVNTQHDSWINACAGYGVMGASVCPLSLLLDIVAKAVDATLDQSSSTSSYAIQRLAMSSPIPAKPSHALTLNINTIHPAESWTFTIVNATTSHTYASGIVTTSTSVQQSAQDFARFQRLVNFGQIQNLTNDLDADTVRGKAVYKSIDKLFQFPSSGQVIKEVSARGDEASGHLKLAFKNAGNALESFLQVPLVCLNSLQDRTDDEVYITTSVGRVEFKDSLQLTSEKNDVWAVSLRFFGLEGPESTCDVFVFNAQTQQLSAIILDVCLAKVKIDSLRQAIDGGVVSSAPAFQSTIPLAAAPPSLPQPIQQLHPQRDPISDLKSQWPTPASVSTLPAEPTPASPSNDLPDITKSLYDLLISVADVEPSELRKDATFPELGIDSLMGIEVAEEMNKLFSVDIDLDDYAATTDLANLCELLASRATGYSYDSGTSSSSSSGQSDAGGSLAESGNMGRAAGTATPDSEVSSEEGYVMAKGPSKTISSHAVLSAFDSVRHEFEVYGKATGCDRFWTQIYPDQASLIVAYITEAFARLDCHLATMRAGEVVPRMNKLDKHDKLMLQLMRALGDDGLVKQASSGSWIRTEKPVTEKPTSEERFDKLIADFPHYAPEHRLLHEVGPKLDRCLTGELKAVPLLFGSPEKRKLMADQYLIAPFQYSVSQQLGSFIKKCYTPQSVHQPLRVLEIGGGTCGTTLHAVKAFAEAGIPVEYTFTDIGSSFVTAAKTKLAAYKFITFKTLDIIEPPRAEMQGYYDMVFATNVIHATPDACTSLKHARQILKPGGALLLMEYTKNYYLLDVVFGQLDGWWAFVDGREHAIQDAAGWKRMLHEAGFGHVDWTGGRTEESKLFPIFLAM